VLAGQVAVYQRSRGIVTTAAIFDLADRRDSRPEVVDHGNFVSPVVAIDAQDALFMHATTQSSENFTVAFRAAVFVGQRFEVVTLMICGYVCVAILAFMIRMRGRRE
jgi:succinylarginine dihydrolase